MVLLFEIQEPYPGTTTRTKNSICIRMMLSLHNEDDLQRLTLMVSIFRFVLSPDVPFI